MVKMQSMTVSRNQWQLIKLNIFREKERNNEKLNEYKDTI